MFTTTRSEALWSLRDEECGLVFSILIPGPLRSNYTSFPADITAMSTSFRAQIYSMVIIAIYFYALTSDQRIRISLTF